MEGGGQGERPELKTYVFYIKYRQEQSFLSVVKNFAM